MISQAIVNGRTHRLMQQNSHDSVHSGSPQPGHAFGLVLDGCGSKYPDGTPSHNEVGAKLLGQFAAAWLKQQLADAAQRAPMGENELGQMLAALHQDCIAFLQTINAAMPWQSSTDTAKFVSTHLLATMVGFVVTPETAVFFWQGDGFLAHNGHVTTLDSNNRPDYLA
ncbi:MAG: protein phosphatase 2C domain-containing protein, partial [Anaerolineales bacterium]|nr:protein phosphatase 2C domain-containing protein [Anaerolineales bacterium]